MSTPVTGVSGRRKRTPIGIPQGRRSKVVQKSGNIKWMSGSSSEHWNNLTAAHQDDAEKMMNPSHFSEGLQLMVEGGDAAATTIGLQAQIAVLQAAVQQQQHQLAAQQEVAQQQAEQLSLAAEAAEQRAEDLRAAYEKAEAEAAAAREKAETAIMQQQQQQQAGLDLCLVRIKLAGRFRASNYVPGAVRIARADNPPAGCRLIMGVIPVSACPHYALECELLLDKLGSLPIKSGQADEKRRQLALDFEQHPCPIATDIMIPALVEAKELRGGRKIPTQANIIQSKPGCMQQKLHWDYDPNLLQCRPRGVWKPASVILALQEGCRIVVWDVAVGGPVSVHIPPGCMLVFDGDVVHAGSWYVSSNVRVHVYLDVDGMERAPNHTWMSQLEKYM